MEGKEWYTKEIKVEGQVYKTPGLPVFSLLDLPCKFSAGDNFITWILN